MATNPDFKREVRRYPSGRPPRITYRGSVPIAEARARFRKRWTEWRDLCVIQECLWIATLRPVPVVHAFRAFYGVEGRYLIQE